MYAHSMRIHLIQLIKSEVNVLTGISKLNSVNDPLRNEWRVFVQMRPNVRQTHSHEFMYAASTHSTSTIDVTPLGA